MTDTLLTTSFSSNFPVASVLGLWKDFTFPYYFVSGVLYTLLGRLVTTKTIEDLGQSP